MRTLSLLPLVALLLAAAQPKADKPDAKPPDARHLPGTRPLTLTGDIASRMVDGVDRFLLKQIDKAARDREKHWKRDFSSAEAYSKSIEPNRQKLAHILGVRDKRAPFKSPELVGTADEPALVGKGANYNVYAVRWPAFGDVHGEGLLLTPSKGKAVADVVAIPDADVTPEQLCGLTKGVAAEAQYARRLAEGGCRVLVPTLIDRTYERRGNAKMTSREYVYRPAFEMGRHIIGYEVQKVLAGVDWFAKEGGEEARIGVIGWGEGGMLALYAGALDTRVKAVCVSGYAGPGVRPWEQPLDRNVFGLLERFGYAELAAMVSPRPVYVEGSPGPELTLPSEGGAPARLTSPREGVLVEDALRHMDVMSQAPFRSAFRWTRGARPGALLPAFLTRLGGRAVAKADPPRHLRATFDPRPRQLRQLKELDRHTQQLLEESHYVRQAFLPIAQQNNNKGGGPGKLDLSSLAAYEKSIEWYRDYFAKEVIGTFDEKLLPANARTRLYQDHDKYTIYQVVLDVFDDVIAYGLLIIPKGMKPGEKRPVVVCQHGLEGRPEDCINEKQGYGAYKAFATKLAERGFVTFAPQNIYIFRDRFRSLQRKANAIGKTLFSVMVPQHQQITDWLGTLPFVDKTRIGFYGLSYGGKSAMRIPPLVKNYCLSICSADFNDWVWKNASTRSPYSYVWTMEYEIFEWDLGSTFNYAEMAALIAPRPFMVERGHFDGVGPDERVALEYAKVRHLYQAKLGLGERTTIEWFVGPHTINGQGTFDFLHKHLKWK